MEHGLTNAPHVAPKPPPSWGTSVFFHRPSLTPPHGFLHLSTMILWLCQWHPDRPWSVLMDMLKMSLHHVGECKYEDREMPYAFPGFMQTQPDTRKSLWILQFDYVTTWVPTSMWWAVPVHQNSVHFFLSSKNPGFTAVSIWGVLSNSQT